MIHMLIVGYCMGIRSGRRLCDEVHLNLAYHWFCRLGLDAGFPIARRSRRIDTGAFARATCCAAFRERGAALYRRGLVNADGFAVDASLIAADSNKQRSVIGSRADAGREYAEHWLKLEIR
jgi:transposase